MSVTLTAPLDAVVNRKNNVTFTWTTSLNGQYAHELQYRLKTATSWSTKGKTNNTGRSASINLSDLIDGSEYYYRLILYYDYKDAAGSIYKGYEYSQAYTLVPCTTRIGRLRIKTSNGIEELPLYSETNKTGPKLKIKLSGSNKGISNNSDNSSTLASKLRTRVSSTATKTSIRGSGSFAYSSIRPSGEIDNRYTYSYYVPEKWNYAYNYHSYYAGRYEPYDTGQKYSYVSGYYYDHTDHWDTPDYAEGSYDVKHSYSYEVVHYKEVKDKQYYYQFAPGQYGSAWYYTYVYDYRETKYYTWYTTYTYTYISGYTHHSNDVYGDLYSYAPIYGYRPVYSYYTYQYYYKQYSAHYNYTYYYSHYSYS